MKITLPKAPTNNHYYFYNSIWAAMYDLAGCWKHCCAMALIEYYDEKEFTSLEDIWERNYYEGVIEGHYE